MMRYKVVETSQVTDESLELILNEWSGKGWQFERFQFVTSEASRRPVMAFVLFFRESEPEEKHQAVGPAGC